MESLLYRNKNAINQVMIIRHVLLLALLPSVMNAQFNNIWELGYFTNATYPKCEINFNSGLPAVTNFNRPMNFRACNASVCDDNGNLLFYTNGIYIANANHDTMQNGSGLNPGAFTNAWKQNGLPLWQGALIIPWPDSSHKYLLFHETPNYDTNVSYRPKELYYSVIDMSLNSGLGAVIQKNIIFINDTLEFAMLTGCRHGNGRDWWVTVRKYQSDIYYRILITTVGIASVDTQHVGGLITGFGGTGLFSPDGNWYASFDNQSMLRIYQFDRCTGLLSNMIYHEPPITTIAGGLSFSPNSRYLYASSLIEMFQYDLQAPNIPASEVLVDTFDGYYSPWPPLEATFLWHALAPDGKIYVSSLSGVVDLGVINSPDSGGLACNFQQHSFYMGGFNVHSLPNHINYQLSAWDGSLCDTLGINTSVQNEAVFDFKFSISPNPSNGSFKIIYLLPQNKNGSLEIFDINGRKVYSQNLPQWSTLQYVSVPDLPEGIYQCVITSDGKRAVKKVAVIKE